LKTVYFALISIFFAMNLFAKEVIIVNDSFPPYVELDSSKREVNGIDMEMAKKILKKNGITYKIIIVPWSRALRMLEDGEADMTTTISPTDDRSEFLNFSQPYRTSEEMSFFVLNDSDIEINSLYDLRRSTLGLTRGFVYPKIIVENNNIQKKYLGGVEEGFKLLKEKRIRIFLVNTVVGEKMIAKFKLGKFIKKLNYKINLEGEASNAMFGFSKKSAHKELIDLFNAEIRSRD